MKLTSCLVLCARAAYAESVDLAGLAAQLGPKLAPRQAQGVSVQALTPADGENPVFGKYLAERLSLALVNKGYKVVASGAGTLVNGSFSAKPGTVFVDATLVDAASGALLGGASESLKRDADIDARLSTSSPASSLPDPLPAAAESKLLTVPAGEIVRVRLIDPLSGKTARLGKRYRASLDQALVAGGATVAARQTDVQLQVTESSNDFVALGLATIRTADGVARVVRSEPVRQDASKSMSRVKTGIIGAAVGAAVGAAAAKGKGAAVGAAAGGGTGAALGGRHKLEMPAEMLLEFKLAGPITVERGRLIGQ